MEFDCWGGGCSGAVSGGSGSTDFTIEFTINSTVYFTFDGLVRGSLAGIDPPGFPAANGRLTLDNAGGGTIVEWVSNNDTSVQFDETVELAPGQYTLSGNASGSVGAQQNCAYGIVIAQISIEAAACPADLTGNGILDLADVQAFVAGFTGQDPIADLDPDGVFHLADVQSFVTSFNAGCP